LDFPCTPLGDELPGDNTIEHLAMELSSAGTALVAALAEEASLSAICCKHPDDEALYLKWARARQVVEECQAGYCTCLEHCGFPEAKIRYLLET
jgi:hypothetical protein